MQGLMKFHPLLLKILRKQNVKDGRTDGRRNARTDGWMYNVKTVYLPTNTVCGGYKNKSIYFLYMILYVNKKYGTKKDDGWTPDTCIYYKLTYEPTAQVS